MKKNRLPLFTAIVSFGLIMACMSAPLASTQLPVTDIPAQLSGTGNPVALPGTDTPVATEEIFPRVPNPISVLATLDTDRAVTYDPSNYTRSIKGESADGTLISLDLLWFKPLMEDADVGLVPFNDAQIIMTPVSTIEGIPFENGYLSAVHLGPDGLLSVREAYLTLDIQGEYDPSTLIGFAADGSGEDFHLYPASFYSYDGHTYANFNIMHFSLYGVAQVIESEILAQTAHPPANPASQDEEELAPLVRIEDDLAPLMNKKQLQLSKSYDRLLKRDMGRLESTDCKQVSTVAYNFNSWVSRVKKANQTDFFKNQIKQGQQALLDKLTNCLGERCSLCLGENGGVAPDKKQVSSMLVMIAYASDLSSALKLGDERSNYWWYFSYECSKKAGLPLPMAGIADGGPGSSSPLACP
jgi:hypothetical protein